MEKQSFEMWNYFHPNTKKMIVILKELSYGHGELIIYDEFTPTTLMVFGHDFNNSDTAIQKYKALIDDNSGIGFISSNPSNNQSYSGYANSFYLTEKGMKFIFNNQSLIDRWAEDNQFKPKIYNRTNHNMKEIQKLMK